VSDLLLALEDKNAWTDLNLPGRLKLEIKSELLGIQAKKDVAVNMPLKEHWVRYFSKPDNSFFYCNSETFVSRWELPEGNVEIHDDISTENSPNDSEKIESSSTKTNNSFLGFGRKALNFDESCLDVLIERSQSPKATPVSPKATAVSPKTANRMLLAKDPLTADVIRVDNAYAIPDEVLIARIATADINDHSHIRANSSSRYNEFAHDEGSVDSLDSDLDAEEDEPDPLIAKRYIKSPFRYMRRYFCSFMTISSQHFTITCFFCLNLRICLDNYYVKILCYIILLILPCKFGNFLSRQLLTLPTP
jgi:hypothetical protein